MACREAGLLAWLWIVEACSRDVEGVQRTGGLIFIDHRSGFKQQLSHHRV